MIAIRPAQQSDVGTIVRWRLEAAAWSRSQGGDQWDTSGGLTRSAYTDRVTAGVEDGTVWIATDGAHAVGTVAVDDFTDPNLWTEQEIADALFMHRLIVPRAHAGRGISDVLIRFARHLARRAGKPWLRGDTWTSSERLRKWYREHGWSTPRIAASDSPSNGLIEIPCEQIADEVVTVHGVDTGNGMCLSPDLINPRRGGLVELHQRNDFLLRFDGCGWTVTTDDTVPYLATPVGLAPRLTQLDIDVAHRVALAVTNPALTTTAPL